MSKSAFKLPLLYPFQPQFFSFCMDFQKSANWQRRPSAACQSCAGSFELVAMPMLRSLISSCRVNVEVAAPAELFVMPIVRRPLGPKPDASSKTKSSPLRYQQLVEQRHIHRIVHISVAFLRPLNDVQRRQNRDTRIHNQHSKFLRIGPCGKAATRKGNTL